ncbi:UDP-N-acetylmuramoyl-L-alanine--D-glutamate ligase [Candidatus Poribacteria bacterium]|nr:UDP-N-acetylmuramoyl-L-alanine--D-glutamate ligase [Candidatus Poribacteria bacterium]
MGFLDLFRNKMVVVLGLARSGEAAAELLVKIGARVLVSDLKTEEQLKDSISRLKQSYPQIKFHLGSHPESIINNADLVVISPGVPSNIPILNKSRGKGIPVIGEIELAYMICRCPIIAITGTKGKSTTSTLLGRILNTKYNTIVAGNIGKPISQYVLDLKESDLLVLETSSFQLETILDFTPEVSVILNISRDHLDRYDSVDDYIAAKYRIFENQGEEDYTVLNGDDPITMACASQTQGKVVLFSRSKVLEQGVYLEGEDIVSGYNGERISILNQNELKIPGNHNLENVMAAIAVSMIYKVKLEDMREQIKSFPGLEHALEFVDEVKGIKFINDSKCTNVVSLKAALESFPSPSGKKNLILIIGGRDKGNDYEPVKSLVGKNVKHLVIIGESAEKIQNEIGSYAVTHRAKTLEDAVHQGYSLAKPGDIVLLSPACASFDMFIDYSDRGAKFKGLVKDIVESEKPKQ